MKNKWPAIAGDSIVLVPIKKVISFVNPEDTKFVAETMDLYGRTMYAHGIKVGGTIGALVTLGTVAYVIYKVKKEEGS